MIEILKEIIELQSEWQKNNSSAMKRRGQLIRTDLKNALEVYQADIAAAMGIDEDDLVVEGRDGTGLKSRVPWLRFGSKIRSPSANFGWYCVFLFRPQADGVYLCLSHGSTIWNKGSFKPRPKEEIAPLVKWGRKTIAEEMQKNGIIQSIDLAKANPLATAYENTTIAAKLFLKVEDTNDADLVLSLLHFCKMVGELYLHEDLGKGPNAKNYQAQEFQDEVKAMEKGILGRRRQGSFGLTSTERKAVEMRAMELSEQYLIKEGFNVNDVSLTHSCDLLAKKNKITYYVEIKGTTGDGNTVILTKNEVALHQVCYPNNYLIIVHSIQLDKKATPPHATKGVIWVQTPWDIEEKDLTPLSFQYSTSL